MFQQDHEGDTRARMTSPVVESRLTGPSMGKFTASVLVKTEPIEEGLAVHHPLSQVYTRFDL